MSVTSEPVRARIWALTRSMSGATSSVSRSIVAWGLSNGTMTATADVRILRRAGEPPRPTGQWISIKTPRKPDKGAVAAAAIDLKDDSWHNPGRTGRHGPTGGRHARARAHQRS